ncbi:hypothetical protein GCM10009430_07500 [Aquimarina litoralis]|uniref:Uncharacterized protein n=1 Tax=Aquimarina litoralis TaxID=584605 RepID=A0ABN1IJH1_9FLAO
MTIKYNGNSNTILLSKSNFLLDLNIFTTPSIIETIKKGVGRLIPKGSNKNAM